MLFQHLWHPHLKLWNSIRWLQQLALLWETEPQLVQGISVEDERDIVIKKDTDTTTLPYKIFSFYDNQSNFIKFNLYDENQEIIASKFFILPKIIYPY